MANSTSLLDQNKPQHLAVIMDGNGRWATQRHLPRTAGHIQGVRTVRRIIRFCLTHSIPYLSLFAFSSENWRRPAEEVKTLLDLFTKSLLKELKALHRFQVRLRIIGDLSVFDRALQERIAYAQQQTIHHNQLELLVYVNYGGRWEIKQAVERLLQQYQALNIPPEVSAHQITEEAIESHLSTAGLPEPDLLIRTGGEQRISNFMIWQMAYTEFYFTEKYWPEMRLEDFFAACQWYAQRERRFGRISAQLKEPLC